MTGSKFLSAAAGGIGVGIGSADLVTAFNAAVRDLSEGGNGMLQTAFGSVLAHCDASVARLSSLYHSRALGYTELLEQAGFANARAGIGDGGMFLFPPTGDINADELTQKAEEEGVIIRPGSMYMDTGDDQTPQNMNYIRICLRENIPVAERSFAILGRLVSEIKG
jgi:DNA-binding transcriptional MocR family regulator